jgi:NDP-sugar pyrophosphorylase family protein
MVQCAAILAGGLGTRLRGVVDDRPKVMAAVAGRPFITHLLDQLVDSGITRIVLCTGYLADDVRTGLGSCYRGVDLVYSEEVCPLGTGGALRHASGLMTGDTVLVLNGDSYCQCSVRSFVERWAASGARAGMVLARVDEVSRFGAVNIDADNLVVSFAEKGGQSGPGLINAGLYLLPVDLIREIPTGRAVSLEREVIPQIIADGLFGYRSAGLFIDIGIPLEYQRAQTLFPGEVKGTP